MVNPVIVQEMGKTERKTRRPQHRWYVRRSPFALQPVFIAPVLPGETLDKAYMQTRVVSHPIENKLIGWWQEYYIFYVKLRDLTDRDDLTEMLIDINKDMSSHADSDNNVLHHLGGNGSSTTINFTRECLRRVTEEYFRDEGEGWGDNNIGGVPGVQFNVKDWSESAILDDNYTIEDVDVDLDADSTITASEVQRAMAQWKMLREAALTDLTYEDYLRAYGVRVSAAEEAHRPELIRYIREWSYPANTINPSDGAPSSAMSWSINESIEKRRLFKEPGFLFGCSVSRPKVYFNQSQHSLAHCMVDAMSWLPALLNDDPHTSMKFFAQGEPPLPNVTDLDGYWIDMKDLFMNGDQFLNFVMTGEDVNQFTSPTTGLLKKYPTSGEVDALFVSATDKYVEEDGVINLHIKSALRNTSIGTPPSTVG